MLKNITFAILFSCLALTAISQTTVTGVITDTNGDALIGATIVVEGTTTGTTTDVDGRFSLVVPEGTSSNLVISYTGYVTQSVAVPSNGNLNITLKQDALQLQDLVVTANKKAQNSQSVPLSISVLSPQQLRRSGATEFRDYASSVPNLAFGTQGGGGAFNDGRTSNQISLRGITGANTTVMMLDETPLPANIDPRLIDVARVEVLRGPQGTLYGSSTMGGAVKVVTNDPNTDQVEGSVSASLATVSEGDLDYGVNGILNIPISDKVAFRAMGYYDFETGVYDQVAVPGAEILNSGPLDAAIDGTPATIMTDNISAAATDIENIDDETNYGFQASLGFYPNENISIVPKIIYQNQKGDAYDFADISPDNFEQRRSSTVNEFFEDEWTHYSLTAKINLKKGRIVSSTSYTDRSYLESEDEGEFLSSLILEYPSAGPGFWAGTIERGGEYDRFVQELRFQSDLGGKFDFTAGLFYSDENLVEAGDSKKPGFISFLGADFLEEFQWWEYDNDQATQELSLFGELYYNITPQLKFTAGIRYFDATSDRAFTAFGAPIDYDEIGVDQSVSENGINPKFNLTYKIDKDKLVYGTVSKGFRLGGLNFPFPENWCADAIAELGGQPPVSFDSDALWNYELGFKATWANGRIITNTAVFMNDWSGLQQRRFFPECGLGFVSNVGSARSTGLELDIKAKAAKGLDIGLAIGLLDATIQETVTELGVEKGDRILFTPKSNFGLNAQYSADINSNSRWYIRFDLQNVGERFSTFNADEDPARVLDAYTLLNARAGVNFSNFEINIFANNLTGEQANFGDITSLAAEVAGRPRYATNRPRTIGLQGRYYF